MSFLGSLTRTWARNVDYANSSRAPLDTDGARPRTHSTETRVVQLQEVLSKPILTRADFRAFKDLIKHGDALDDRKMLLEALLVKMARFKDFKISLKLQQAVIDLLYKDLPHPPNGFLCPLEFTKTIYDASQPGAISPPKMPERVHYAYRAADGSNYNPFIPGIGKAGSPYARSVPSSSLTPLTTLPDPHLVFDTLLKRDKFVPHPDGISSLFFAFANLVIHSIFNTDPNDSRINRSSSYLDLSVLYGSSEQDVNRLRVNDGTGKLIPDCFADVRLLVMPPASCALLILLNRNHNYIAQKLLEINESQRFKDPSLLSEEDKKIQDDEIFHRTRLVNCGYFMHIILGDYVGAILGLVRDGYDWRLDPLMNMREFGHDVSVRGAGNVVSLEFNLLYRWHATLSKSNVDWLEGEFARALPRGAGTANSSTFKKAALDLVASAAKRPPWEWNFGGKSRIDGRFRDADLAEILQSATQDVAGAFKARGIPERMKFVEVLGIMQSRQWGTCSLNEFRKFMGLKPYANFSEWNSDQKIAKAAEALYKDIDRLELHVGLQAEESKVPGPGAGLCPGYTISRAILADAVCLTRGDRFLTTDFTPFNLTAWGWQDCQYDKEDGSYGGLLTKLLFRTLPDDYPAGSVLAHFPFTIPEKMRTTFKARGDGSIDRYRWPSDLETFWQHDLNLLPPTVNHTWKIVNDLDSVKKVLTTEAINFTSVVPQRQAFTVGPVLQQCKRVDRKNGAWKAIQEKQAAVTEVVVSCDRWLEYFKKKTETLMEHKSFKQAEPHSSHYVDIVQDVINLLPVHWICEEISGIPLKSACNPRGAMYEQETFSKFADIAQYIYINFDPVDNFKLRERAQKYAEEVIDFIKDELDGADGHFTSIGGDVLEWVKINKRSASAKFLRKLRGRIGGINNTQLAISVFNATIPTAALFSKAVAQVVDYFLDEVNKHARAELVKIYREDKEDASTNIMGYVREALRLNPLFAGVYRTVINPVPAQRLDVGDWAFVDIAKANISLGETFDFARPAEKQGILTPYEDGLLTPKFFEAVVPVIVGTILSKKDLKRAEGESGKLTKFKEIWHGTENQQYVNMSGLVTPWPDAMIVEFESKASICKL